MSVVLGFSPDRDDHGAVHLAAQLARSAGIELVAVTVIPPAWPTPTSHRNDADFSQWAKAQGRSAATEVEQLFAEICPDLTTRVVTVEHRSVAAGLVEHATGIEAAILVVGSSREGGYGRVHLSPVADRLLHSAPLPVAVPPRGYGAPDGARVHRATCAFRGDEVSHRTLELAATICDRVQARLRVATFAARGRTMFPPEVGLGAEDLVLQEWAAQAGRAQEAALTALGSERAASVELAVSTGRSWPAALDGIAWSEGDVLVIGSSASHLMERLFLGSSATKIVRAAPVPVIVVR